MTTGRINQVASIDDPARHAAVATTDGGTKTGTTAGVIQGNRKLRGTPWGTITAHVHRMHRIQENSRTPVSHESRHEARLTHDTCITFEIPQQNPTNGVWAERVIRAT